MELLTSLFLRSDVFDYEENFDSKVRHSGFYWNKGSYLIESTESLRMVLASVLHFPTLNSGKSFSNILFLRIWDYSISLNGSTVTIYFSVTKSMTLLIRIFDFFNLHLVLWIRILRFPQEIGRINLMCFISRGMMGIAKWCCNSLTIISYLL